MNIETNINNKYKYIYACFLLEIHNIHERLRKLKVKEMFKFNSAFPKSFFDPNIFFHQTTH